jgi:hypothetical protein
MTRERWERGKSEHTKMRFLLSSCATILFATANLFLAENALAEPIPLPNVDFQAKATMMGKMNMTLRQSAGKARVELQAAGMPQMTGIMDLKARKMLMIGAVPGMSNMALEIELGKDTGYGQVIGNGRRVGTDTVVGEPCELWEMDEAKNGTNGGPVIACLARDNIPLRTEMTIEGKRRIVMEVTELKRERQDPALFAVPANVQVMKMPKGAAGALQSIPGMPGNQ